MKSTSRTSAARSLAGYLCIGLAGMANAATTTLPVGGDFTYVAPGGYGGTPVQFNGGYSTITFSKGADYDPVDATTLDGAALFMAVTRMAIRPNDPATSISQFPLVYDSTPEGTQQVPGSITSKIASMTLDPTNATVASVNMAGSFSFEAPLQKGLLSGGVVTVSNLRFDLANKRVLANLDGLAAATKALPAQSFNLRDATLWTFEALSGPTVYPFESWFSSAECIANRYACLDTPAQLEKAGYTVDSQTFQGKRRNLLAFSQAEFLPTTGYYVNGEMKLNGLSLTREATDFLSKSWGLLPGGVAALNYTAYDFGSVTLQTRHAFGAAVPEPETYALMGLGLCLVAGAARRQQRRAG
jgi:hypothetical protein